MTLAKEKIHIVASYLLNPTNPISVNLIGAGGTGSQVLTALARMNYALNNLGHAGLSVTIFDPDTVEQPNLGRQMFTQHEIGMNKAVAISNRVNRFFGTNWKGISERFPCRMDTNDINKMANITLSCVDSASARLDIGEALNNCSQNFSHRDNPLYWMDFGNLRDCGQVLLCSLGNILQPKSKIFETISVLPPFVSGFKSEESEVDEPSCSLEQALGRQDLFVNSALANLGASLLWSMFREGMLKYKGFYLNMNDFKTQPIKL